MSAKAVLSSLLMLLAVGCGSQATVRQFDVPFSVADQTLRELYPSGTYDPERPLKDAPVGATFVDIRRNELAADQVTVRVREEDQQPGRTTEIVLRKVEPATSEVSVQTSKSRKAVLMPSRDEAYEQKQMDAIAEKLKK